MPEHTIDDLIEEMGALEWQLDGVQTRLTEAKLSGRLASDRYPWEHLRVTSAISSVCRVRRALEEATDWDDVTHATHVELAEMLSDLTDLSRHLEGVCQQ